MEFIHKSVLFDEAIESLNVDGSKIILDGTAGGGGHSSEIAKKAKLLIAVDQDPDAISVLNERLGDRENVRIVQNNFENIKEIVSSLGIEKIDGVLLDLGVSSFQLDTADRGFSFHSDAELDMRMSKSGLSAKDVVNTYSKEALTDILYRYGEEKFAPRIAANIVQARQEKPIETTFELNEIIKIAIPAKMREKGGHPSKRTYQALRIECNKELEVLKDSLDDMIDCLKDEGRLCIITFHSLEDRAVKNNFRTNENPCTCPPNFPVCVCGKVSKGKVVNKKPIIASEEEMNENPRSQSAKLRIFEKRG